MEEKEGATTPGWTSVRVCPNALCRAIAQRSEKTTSNAYITVKSTQELMLSTRKERDELHWRKEEQKKKSWVVITSVSNETGHPRFCILGRISTDSGSRFYLLL